MVHTVTHDMSILPEPPYTIPSQSLHFNLAELEALLFADDDDMPIDGDAGVGGGEGGGGEEVTDEDIVAALEQLSDEQGRDMMVMAM